MQLANNFVYQKLLTVGLSLIVVICSPVRLNAQTTSWTGAVDPQFWSVSGNWTNGVPFPNSEALFSGRLGNRDIGLRVFSGLSVRRLTVQDFGRAPLRPEGLFTVTERLSVRDAGTLSLQSFNNQTRLVAAEVSVLSGRLETFRGTTLETGVLTAGQLGSLLFEGDVNVARDVVASGQSILTLSGSRMNVSGRDLAAQSGSIIRVFGGSLNTSSNTLVSVEQGSGLQVGTGSPVLSILNVGNSINSAGDIQFGSMASASVGGGLDQSTSGSTTISGGSLGIAQSFANNGTINLLNSGTVTVGGTLDQQRFGTTNVQNGSLTIGQSLSNQGTVLVQQDGQVSIAAGLDQGANGSMVISGSLTIGQSFSNQGTVVVQQGGQVSIAAGLDQGATGNTVLLGGSLSVGTISSEPGSVFTFNRGDLRVTGTAGLNVGEINNGSLSIGVGSRLNIDHTLAIDVGQSVTVLAGQLQAGDIVLNGGTLQTAVGPLVVNQVATNNRISGAGVIRGSLEGNINSVIEANGGTLILDLTGASSPSTFLGTIDAGSDTIAILSDNVFDLGNQTHIGDGGQLVSFQSGLRLGDSRTLTSSGNATIDGLFTNNGTVNGSAVDGEFLTFLDDVNGSGSYTGSVLFSDAFNPGNSPGSVSFENLFLDKSSTLMIELGGSLAGTEFDFLSVSGNATLGGSLDVSLFGGFELGEGQTFDFLSIDGTRNGQFLGLGEGGLVGIFSGRDLFITYAGGDGNDVSLFSMSAVPEPKSGLLLLVFSAVFANRRHRSYRA